jgi:nitroreductase
MSFFDLISTRHSVRAFKDESISDDHIKKILEASTSATSAGNLQSYKIFIVTKKELKKKLADATHDQRFIEDASAVFIFCADPKTSATEYGKREIELYSIQNATIACSYAQLAAHSLGFASVLVGSFNEDVVGKIIEITSSLKPIAMLVVGFAAEKPEITTRKPMNEISRIV